MLHLQSSGFITEKHSNIKALFKEQITHNMCIDKTNHFTAEHLTKDELKEIDERLTSLWLEILGDKSRKLIEKLKAF